MAFSVLAMYLAAAKDNTQISHSTPYDTLWNVRRPALPLAAWAIQIYIL